MRFYFITLIWLSLLSPLARADVLVLVHGYLGSAESWKSAGVTTTLEQYGYHLQGTYFYSPQGTVYQNKRQTGTKPVYLVNLPSRAPALIQADWLRHYVHDLQQRHPKQNITLVGHSAGGLVARLYLVRYQPQQVSHLLTIASPHQGTTRASQALNALNSGGMFGLFKDWAVRQHLGDELYQTLQQSQGLLYDLSPPQPGNLLFWLNQQTHPNIRYTSIIRTGSAHQGDIVVPSFSQDLRLIPVLNGMANSYTSAKPHLLHWQDGSTIAKLVDN